MAFSHSFRRKVLLSVLLCSFLFKQVLEEETFQLALCDDPCTAALVTRFYGPRCPIHELIPAVA